MTITQVKPSMCSVISCARPTYVSTINNRRERKRHLFCGGLMPLCPLLHLRRDCLFLFKGRCQEFKLLDINMWFPKSECMFICRLRLAPILCFWTKGKTHYNCHLFLQPPQENVFMHAQLSPYCTQMKSATFFASPTFRVKKYHVITCYRS